MSLDAPFVFRIFDTLNNTVPVMKVGLINRQGGEYVCDRVKRRFLLRSTVYVDPKLVAIPDRKELELILELEMRSQSPVKSFSETAAIRVVVGAFGMQVTRNTILAVKFPTEWKDIYRDWPSCP